MKRNDMLLMMESKLKFLIEEYTSDIVLDMSIIKWHTNNLLKKQEELGMMPPDNNKSNYVSTYEWDSE